MSTHYFAPERRAGLFKDIDGRLTATKYEDEYIQYVLDFADRLGTDTISTVTWTLNGPVHGTGSPTNTTTTCTVIIGKTGTGEVKVVTAGNQTFIEKFRWRGIDDDGDDYA